MHLPSAPTIVSIYVLGHMFGFVGLIIATLAMAHNLKQIQDVNLTDVLGEEEA